MLYLYDYSSGSAVVSVFYDLFTIAIEVSPSPACDKCTSHPTHWALVQIPPPHVDHTRIHQKRGHLLLHCSFPLHDLNLHCLTRRFLPHSVNMKATFFGLGLAAVVASVTAIEFNVASCADLEEIDDTTVTSLTITSTPFACDSYTRFRVRNDMVLKSDSAVEFSNFALKVLGTLKVEPDVTFQDVTDQVSTNNR